MKINFLRLDIQNFRSVGEETSIDFTKFPNLSLIEGINNDIDHGSHDVKANNGSGKSTVIDAILFSLYGKTLKATDNKSIINRSIGTKLRTFCRFTFRIGENTYISEAFLNIKGKSNPTVGFKFQVNDEEPQERNTPQMKEMIENQILGCPYELFKSSIVISQSSYVNFYEMTKAQKIAYIEQLFRLTVFGDILKLVRADHNSSKSEYNQMNVSLSNLSDQYNSLKSKNDNFEADKQRRIDQLKTSITLKEKAVSEYREMVSKLQEGQTMAKTPEELQAQEKAIGELQDKITRYQAAIGILASKVEELKKSIGKHSEVLDILCQDCYGKADKLLNIEASKKEIEDNEDKKKKIEDALKLEISKLDEMKTSHQADFVEARTEYERSKKIELANNSVEYAIKEKEQLEKQLSETESQVNPFEDLVLKHKSGLDEVNERMSGKVKQIRNLQLLDVAFGAEGAKKLILADLANKINEMVKYYLIQLGSNYTVVFDSGFGFEFVTATGTCNFDDFSSGEQQRINLATMLSFRDLITGNRITSDVFILDEVLDSGIDQLCVKYVVDSIKSMSKSSGSKMMVISHNQTVIEEMKNSGNIGVLTAIKTDNKTAYETTN